MFGELFWRNRNTTSLTFCLGISFISMVWQGNLLSRGVGVIGGVGDRISNALNSTLRFTGTVFVELDRYRELERRYASAQKRLEEYRLEKDKFDALRAENDRLRKDAGFLPRVDYRELEAEVLGVRLNSISPRIIIGKGTRDGVQVYMPVITRAHDKDQNLIRAAVGIVIAADESSAIVQPLTHGSFRLGVRLGETGQWAILSGNSGSISHAKLTYIAAEAEPNKVTISRFEGVLKEGTPVVTSGGSGLFPPGVPVGTVQSEGGRLDQFRTALLKPYAAIDRLDFVTVILKPIQPWSERVQLRKKGWDEHLQTPFGDADFKGMPVKHRDVSRGSAQKEPETEPDIEPGPDGENPPKEAKKVTGDESGQKRRRLKNLEGP